jgi:hypothetical protein
LFLLIVCFTDRSFSFDKSIISIFLQGLCYWCFYWETITKLNVIYVFFSNFLFDPSITKSSILKPPIKIDFFLFLL